MSNRLSTYYFLFIRRAGVLGLNFVMAVARMGVSRIWLRVMGLLDDLWG